MKPQDFSSLGFDGVRISQSRIITINHSDKEDEEANTFIPAGTWKYTDGKHKDKLQFFFLASNAGRTKFDPNDKSFTNPPLCRSLDGIVAYTEEGVKSCQLCGDSNWIGKNKPKCMEQYFMHVAEPEKNEDGEIEFVPGIIQLHGASLSPVWKFVKEFLSTLTVDTLFTNSIVASLKKMSQGSVTYYIPVFETLATKPGGIVSQRMDEIYALRDTALANIDGIKKLSSGNAARPAQAALPAAQVESTTVVKPRVIESEEVAPEENVFGDL